MDRLLGGLSLGAGGVLLFTAGAIFASGQIYPGPQIGNALEAGQALYGKYAGRGDVHLSDTWARKQTDLKGVAVNRIGGAPDGLTLYATGDRAAVYLIDANGDVVHEWARPFSSVWEPGKGDLTDPQPDAHIYFRHAHAYPNGDLLAIYEGVGDTPYGYGLVKLNRYSEVLWTYFGRAHHQFSIAPDGTIYVLTHAFTDDKLDRLEHLKRPRLDDFLVVLSPDGRMLARHRLLTALKDSPYRHTLYTVSGFALGDPLHANAVKYIDAESARNFAFGEEGQLLLSFRETNGLVVFDPRSGKITWGARGPWLGQHDPDILANGHILLFDNYGDFSDVAGVSRVIEFDPVTMEIAWQYGGSAEKPLESRIRSDQQRLPNGDTLITESSGGRILQVDRAGDIVWEFVNPVRGGPDDAFIPIIAWSERIPEDYFDAAFRNSFPSTLSLNRRRTSQ